MNSGFVTGPAPTVPQAPWVPGFVISIVLVLAGVGMLALWVGERRLDNDAGARKVEASYDRRIDTTDLLTVLESAESAQRGYVITGDPVFLRSYEPARGALMRHLEDLRLSYMSDPTQRARLERLKTVITAKMDEMAEVIQRRASGDTRGAFTRVADGQGRLFMQEAYTIVRGLITAEDRTLALSLQRSRDEVAARDRIIWILVGTLAAILLMAIVARLRGRLAHHVVEMQAYETLIRLRAVFAGTSEAMLILNPSGTVEDVNAAGTRLLGYDTATLKRQDVSVLLDIAEGEGSFESRLGIVDGVLRDPHRLDRIARRRDGSEVPVDVSLGLMPLADGLHVVALLRNVADRKEAERLKDAFISTVSHELRTPLTSIVGALGLLRGGAAGELAPPVRRLIDIAENNSRRLIRLINDILDIDRIGCGQARLDLAPTDVTLIARASADDARGLAAARGITIALDLPDRPVRTQGDPDRLAQVLGNLLSNAIRFSPDQGTVTLTLAQEDQRVLLRVADQGPGIAPEFCARIFGRFAQSDAGAAIAGGSGLGLAISREIVKAHGGDIWFEDGNDGRGTCFCIALSAFAEAPTAIASEGPLILVCEADPETTQSISTIVEASDYRVERCRTAQEAKTLARTGRYDGVVLDLILPDGQSLEVIRAIRASAGTRSLPILMVSSPSGEGERDGAAFALDMIDWIDKPVEPSRLLDALDVAIARAARASPVILHIDDDPDMLEVTALALSNKGRILGAGSIAAARAMIAAEAPDIVILDLNLPDGSGLDLLPELLAIDGAMPVIIYSASELPLCDKHHFEAVLVKSRRSAATLSDAIGRALARRGSGESFVAR